MKIRNIGGIILSALLIIGLITGIGFTVFAETEVEVGSAEEFLEAIESGRKGIRITNSFTLARQSSDASATLEQGKDFLPIIIPADTVIVGSGEHSIGFRFPVQLAGNVTFEGVGLVFSNVSDYQRTIFMGGHELTLKNISSSDGSGSVYDFNIYAGSFDFESNAPVEGTAARLIIDAPNNGSAGAPDPEIANVYLSLSESELPRSYAGYNGAAHMTVSQKTRIGAVYAKGASVTVNGSGMQASTSNYITDESTTLTLESGVTQNIKGGAFKEIVLPAGATLDITGLKEDASVSLARLVGGGTVVRDGSGSVTVTSYTGSTTLRSSAPENKASLLKTEQAPDGTNKMVLDSINQNAGYKLKYENGEFVLGQATVSNIPYIEADGTESSFYIASIVDSDTTVLENGCYVVNSDVTVSGRITVIGDVHLILADGCTLTAKHGIHVTGENYLTLYGQQKGTGTLKASTYESNNAAIGGNNGQSGGYITINGGTVIASGGAWSAAIGGGMYGSGGNITINGGTVTANSGMRGAAIGGGDGRDGGTITINGGIVTVNGITSGAGIGGGASGDGGAITINGGTVVVKASDIGGGDGGAAGTFGANGNAFIVASYIQNQAYMGMQATKGVIINGDSGRVFGDVTLAFDATLPAGKTLTVNDGQTLTVSEGVTLTNNGSITNNGRITNNGSIVNNGTISGSGEIRPVTVTFKYNDGTTVDTQQKADGTGKLASLPTPSNRKGYTFDGWYDAEVGGNAVDLNRIYDGETVLYARWSYAKYNLWIAGVQVTHDRLSGTAGDGTWSYDPDTHTLTLSDATIAKDSSSVGQGNKKYMACIGSDSGTLRLVLVGDNRLSTVSNSSEGAVYAYNLIICGEGSLTIEAEVAAIHCENNFTLESGRVIAVGDTRGVFANSDFTVIGGYLEAKTVSANYGYAIIAYGGFSIKGGTVYAIAEGADSSKDYYGIFTSRFEMSGGDVTAVGSKVGIYSDIASGEFSIVSGILTVQGGNYAVWLAPSLSGYTDSIVISSASYDGADPVAYNGENIGSYKYLRILKAHTVTFDYNDGITEETVQKTDGAGKLAVLPAPTRSGYIFEGWYADISLGDNSQRIDIAKVFTEDMTLYAVWSRCDHSASTQKPDCDSGAICTSCGGEIAELGHDFSGGTAVNTDGAGHYNSCSRCEVTDRENAVAHGYDNNCDSTCNICGYIRSITHDYTVLQKNEAGHWYICTVCGAEQPDSRVGHSGGVATCTQAAVCEACQASYGALDDGNHDIGAKWLSDQDGHWHECSRCKVKTDKAEHKYNDGGICVCGAEKSRAWVTAVIIISVIAVVGIGGVATALIVVKKKKSGKAE